MNSCVCVCVCLDALFFVFTILYFLLFILNKRRIIEHPIWEHFCVGSNLMIEAYKICYTMHRYCTI